MPSITYNERSWAIDVISEINLFLSNKSWNIKSAGGENTISNENSSLFPDVLVFKDQSKSSILQGWELKMPDTLINDPELINNAIKKAGILKRDSFVLWNVKNAALYTKQGDSYVIFKSWESIDINNRTEVKSKEYLWKRLLYQILSDLNLFYQEGTISDEISGEILSVEAVIDVILESVSSTEVNIKSAFRVNAKLDALVEHWWLSSASEYGYNPRSAKDEPHKLSTLSKVVLTDWVFKIIFAHVLKRHFNEARAIEEIKANSTIFDAKRIISSISESCNFWNIFSDNLALEYVSISAWKQIIQLNGFLSSISIESIEVEILHNLLQASIISAKRKVAGQFATPRKLADLLVRLTLLNREGRVFDPCCGTGTIINETYLLKEESGLVVDEIVDSVWASDKHSFPIQLATVTLAKPNNIGKVLNIFRADVIDLNVGDKIEFKNPNDGQIIQKDLPQFDCVVSNLPFIKSREITELNPNITRINGYLLDKTDGQDLLTGKSDIYVYIPFYLHNLLTENGRIGLILSNAWMGTDYGEVFLKLFQKFFTIEKVLISGCGKWFDNADVVATLLIAQKRDPRLNLDHGNKIQFCTINKKLQDVSYIKVLANNILLERQCDDVAIREYSLAQISLFEKIGIPWCGYFADVNWIVEVAEKLINANDVFHFIRGERRGWNALFYPVEGHNIEAEYIKPVLKNLRETTGLYCKAEGEAFCCSRSIQELEQLKHYGALAWIKSFENQFNEKGIPLKEVLKRANMHWYEMRSESMADFVANVNYDRSLFIASFSTPSFIDQRMIGLSLKDGMGEGNKELLHALMNSIISMFFIESFGFGRGLGALDLRETKFKHDFKILNFRILNQSQKEMILNAFTPISLRDRLPLKLEIIQEDRINFELVLLSTFGLEHLYESIKAALLHLYEIRFAVKEV